MLLNRNWSEKFEKFLGKFPASVSHFETHLDSVCKYECGIPKPKRCLETCKCYGEPYEKQNFSKHWRSCFSQILAQPITTVPDIKFELYVCIWSCQGEGLTVGVLTGFNLYSIASDLEPRKFPRRLRQASFSALFCFNSKVYSPSFKEHPTIIFTLTTSLHIY